MQHLSAAVPLAIRIAAVLLWATAVGFGVPALLTVKNLLTGRDLPNIAGFRAFGGGTFERHGVRTMVAFLLAFLILCVLESLAGWWLWRGEKYGGWLAIGLLPIGASLWWGFALPIPPTLAIVRTVLIAVNWPRLT